MMQPLRLVHGVVTYNRFAYLKKHLETWKSTRGIVHKWVLIVSDDGSKDDTIEFLKDFDPGSNVELIVLFNKRRGPHYQVNRILKLAERIEYTAGFMCEDDVYFLKTGWVKLYYQAMVASGFDHLVYFNKSFAKSSGRNASILHTRDVPGKKIQSFTSSRETFGCFWTFTPKVQSEIGYFDMKNFGVWGHGHTDFTVRCCNAKLNRHPTLWDALGSNDFVGMIDKGYKGSVRPAKAEFVGISDRGRKGRLLDSATRKYIGYNESEFDLLGNKI